MNKIYKEKRDLKISAGLLTGYILAGTANMMLFEKTWKEAFSESELLYGIVGIAISIFVISRLRSKNQEG